MYLICEVLHAGSALLPILLSFEDVVSASVSEGAPICQYMLLYMDDDASVTIAMKFGCFSQRGDVRVNRLNEF